MNNRLKDVAYDASGRQRQWKVGDTSSVAVYDPEGHMTEAKGDSAVTPGTEKIYGSYLYNGDGQRVKSVADGKTVWYVYGLDGGVAAEFATGYTNVNAGKTLYPVTDHLGSTRAWFDQTGTVTQRVDYEPFGGEIQRAGVAGYSGVGDPAQKFTGKERDAETGLDYFGARYLMAGQGRFGSPDPLSFQSEMMGDPQRWNLYAYVRNNPLRYLDPTGQEIELPGDEAKRKKALDALRAALGGKAGDYLKEVKVEGTSRFIVSITDQKAFARSNAVAGEISAIINDKKSVSLEVMNMNEKMPDGKTFGESGPPGFMDGSKLGGNLRIYVLDSRGLADAKIVINGSHMSNSVKSDELDIGIVAAHELGHARARMTGGLFLSKEDSNAAALRLENKVRVLRDPKAATRTKH